jgi:hypothetical protein
MKQPLSIYAQAERKTVIEGTVYYDAKKMKQKRVAVNQERKLDYWSNAEEKNRA